MACGFSERVESLKATLGKFSSKKISLIEAAVEQPWEGRKGKGKFTSFLLIVKAEDVTQKYSSKSMIHEKAY